MTEWVLKSRSRDGELQGYWMNWTRCANDAYQDLKQYNARLEFFLESDRPTEIHFATEEDMVLFLLRWS